MRPSYAHRLLRLQLFFLLAFGFMSLTLVVWGVVYQAELLVREDNPRQVEAELRLQRGRILDTNGLVLADTVWQNGRVRRTYPLPQTSPAVGYYSFRYGTAGVEQAFDALLRGTTSNLWQTEWQQLSHTPQVGQDIRLTIDATLQQQADHALGDRPGAVLLISVPDGAIRTMVSHPQYDPNLLEAQFETLTADAQAPLLNRVTQGQYQPGLMLLPLLVAAGLEQQLITLEEAAPNPNQLIELNGRSIRCQAILPTNASWQDVVQAVCPAPLMELATYWDTAGLQQLFEQFALTSQPNLPLALAEPVTATVASPTLAAIGQDTLTVTPLQLALAWSTLANNGQFVQPRLVSAVQTPAGDWESVVLTPTQTLPIFSAETAAAMLNALPKLGRVAEYSTITLAGPNKNTISWYVGFTPPQAPRYLLVVVVEDGLNQFTAASIGRELLNTLVNEPLTP